NLSAFDEGQMVFGHLSTLVGGFDRDFVALADEETGAVDLAAIDVDVALRAHDTARLARRSEIRLPEHVVESALEKSEQRGTGVILAAPGHAEVEHELTLEQA